MTPRGRAETRQHLPRRAKTGSPIETPSRSIRESLSIFGLRPDRPLENKSLWRSPGWTKLFRLGAARWFLIEGKSRWNRKTFEILPPLLLPATKLQPLLPSPTDAISIPKFKWFCFVTVSTSFYNGPCINFSTVGNPKKHTKDQYSTKNSYRPVHCLRRDFRSGRPKREENADDRVDDREGGDRQPKSTQSKRSPAHLSFWRCKTLDHHYRGRDEERRIKGGNYKGRQGVESGCGSNVDQCKQQANRCRHTDWPQREPSSGLYLSSPVISNWEIQCCVTFFANAPYQENWIQEALSLEQKPTSFVTRLSGPRYLQPQKLQWSMKPRSIQSDVALNLREILKHSPLPSHPRWN